jgi:PAS domain S-box-containing protein
MSFDMSHYHFSAYAIPPLFTSVILLCLGIAVLLRDRASSVSRLFFMMLATTSFWLFAFSWMYAASDESTALLWSKVAYLDIPFICAAIYHFTVHVLGLEAQRRRVVRLAWIVSAIFAGTAYWTDALIGGVYQYWWGYYPKYSWLGLPFLVYFVCMLILSARHYITVYAACPPGTRKMRIKWFLVGFIGPFVAALDFLPKLGVPLYPIGYLSLLWWLGVVGFAVWKYQILHITPSFAADQILQTIADAVLVIDEAGVICIANHAAGPLFRMTESDLLGTPLISIDKSLAETISVAKHLPHGSIHRAEVTLLRPVHNVATLELSASVIKDPTGEAVAMACVLRDVTSRKQAELTLQNVNETLDQQVRARTMELRSLVLELSRTEERERMRLATELHDNLAQVLALSKMRLEKLRMTLTGREHEAIVNVVQLIDDALSCTRMVMSDLRPDFAASANDLITAITWVAERMRKRGLIVDIHHEAPQIVLNEQTLMVTYQSIRELLTNVLKHARTKRAKVYVRCVGGNIEASVIDDGKAFDVSVIKPPGAEGGFGLFNIRERLHFLGGRLDITSIPGHGTTASIVVPVNPLSPEGGQVAVPDSAIAQSSRRKDPTELRQRQVRVVLTDDHQMMREGLRRAIEERGDAEVIAEAGDGERAVQLVRDMQPDVVIMDVGLPKMNGLEATRQIKAEFPNIAVIGFSVSEGSKSEVAMRAMGACAYFSKADSIEALCEAVRGVPIRG